MWKVLAVFTVSLFVLVSAEDPECVGASCHASQGLNFIGKFVRNYLDTQPKDLVLVDGVHLVDVGGPEADARAAGDNSILTSIVNFLQRHELKIKLPELMPDSETMSRTFKQVMDDVQKNDIGGKNHPFFKNIPYNTTKGGTML